MTRHVPEMLRLGRSRVELTVETLMMIDSLDMTDDDRARIVTRLCRVHRVGRSSSRMERTRWWKPPRALADGVADKTVVLTGAMIPYAFGSSDGLFNLGSALSFAQVLPPGIYIAMNGQCFPWDHVRKNTADRHLRVAVGPHVNSQLPISQSPNLKLPRCSLDVGNWKVGS